MSIDYQVLRFSNQIKPKDIGGLGVELDARKGSGNYDQNRTQFNIEYVGFDGHPNLSSKMYSVIKKNEIHFNPGKNTNILNGCIVTSGPDFFRKLGLPMKDTGRVYKEGNHIGEPIYCPDIKSKEDIPEKVYEFFNYSYEFLSNFVEKDNVIYAAIHLDEDTPHMHFYFIPVVDHVERKVFQMDKDGKRITKEITKKDGTVKQVPVLQKDPFGNQVYKIEYGKFLDTDQFWKQKGGKNSFANAQDAFNEFINSKGFDLDRGKIGSHKQHQEKLEHTIDMLKKEAEELRNEVDLYKQINESQLETNKEIIDLNKDKVLFPTKDVLQRYKTKEVDELITYAKENNKEKLLHKSKLERKEIENKQLKKEIQKLKSNELYDKVYEQQQTIDKQKEKIEELSEEKNTWEKVKEVFTRIIKKAFTLIYLMLGKDKEDIERLFNYDKEENFKYFEQRIDKMTKDLNNTHEKANKEQIR